MSAVGYNEIIEYIAEECLEFANAADEVEQDVDSYMESLTQAVQERAEQLAKEKNWAE